MKSIRNFLFSTSLTGILLVVFAVAIGWATIIEKNFGAESAKAIVYNAKWFELFLLLTVVNMGGSIFRYRMYRREKFMVLVFHVAFIVILLGAAITRYIGYEGVMHIREGEKSQVILSDVGYFMARVSDQGKLQEYPLPLRLAPRGTKRFSETYPADGNEVTVRFVNYIPFAEEVVVQKPGGIPALKVIALGQDSEEERFLFEGEDIRTGNMVLGFSNTANMRLSMENGLPHITVDRPYALYDMQTQSLDSMPPDTVMPLDLRKVYSAEGSTFMVTEFMASAVKEMIEVQRESEYSRSMLRLELSSGGESQLVNIPARKGVPVAYKDFTVNGTKVQLGYGSRFIYLPFAVALNDFQLERYPGSMSPSSYASEVTLIDEGNGINRPYRIFMNNVLNYRGYRFFQSSYDKDEKGTILSVNHDAWGTWITYFGYFLLGLGLFLNLFVRTSRYRQLASKMWGKTVKTILVMALLSIPAAISAQDSRPDTIPDYGVVPLQQAQEFGELLVQDNAGRVKPVNTICSELLRKLSRKSSYDGLVPEQVILGMMIQPDLWLYEPIIKVRHEGINAIIGTEGNFASFIDFVEVTPRGYLYKLQSLVDSVNRKDPATRGTFDRELLKVDERFNIMNAIFVDRMLRLFPEPGHPNNRWLSSVDAGQVFPGETRTTVTDMMLQYKLNLLEGMESADFTQADHYYDQIDGYQQEFGSDIIPSEARIKTEILYNKVNPFDLLYKYLGLFGFVMFIVVFVRILNNKPGHNGLTAVLAGLIALGFLAQSAALGMRWYISGHAPWSDGYESMLFIGWAALLVAMLFIRKSPITIAVTGILASIILMTAGHSWMDPQITPLVPVLKSYWLIIHVAVITSSYGFFAIGALLGFINLLLYSFKSAKNHLHIDASIADITRLIEMIFIIGLALMTVGTFLGGVWANESWGRYWGWDPKETWALVTLIWYAFVLHMRLIPGLKSRFWFNFWGLLSFGTVLMTYFGVNFYLSGLHSYASGDAVPLPKGFIYAALIILVVTVLGLLNQRKYGRHPIDAGGEEPDDQSS